MKGPQAIDGVILPISDRRAIEKLPPGEHLLISIMADMTTDGLIEMQKNDTRSNK